MYDLVQHQHVAKLTFTYLLYCSEQKDSARGEYDLDASKKVAYSGNNREV